MQEVQPWNALCLSHFKFHFMTFFWFWLWTSKSVELLLPLLGRRLQFYLTFHKKRIILLIEYSAETQFDVFVYRHVIRDMICWIVEKLFHFHKIKRFDIHILIFYISNACYVYLWQSIIFIRFINLVKVIPSPCVLVIIVFF